MRVDQNLINIFDFDFVNGKFLKNGVDLLTAITALT